MKNEKGETDIVAVGFSLQASVKKSLTSHKSDEEAKLESTPSTIELNDEFKMKAEQLQRLEAEMETELCDLAKYRNLSKPRWDKIFDLQLEVSRLQLEKDVLSEKVKEKVAAAQQDKENQHPL